MTLQPALQGTKEIQEFQFKLLARLRIFDENQKPPIKQPLSLVTSSSKYGLICVGTSLGFDVIQTQKVVEQCAGVKKPAAEVRDFPRRSVNLGVQPSHLDISCDGQQLSVGFTTNGTTFIRIYDVISLTALNERIVNEVRLLSPLQSVSWNPGVPNLLATCMQDGSAAVYEFKGNSFEISSIPVEAQATCLCWSPKGKQIVIGSRNGTLNQFKPELKIVKCIPAPQGVGGLVSVQWLSTVQYAVVYSTQNGACLVIVNTPKNQPITYHNYEDVTYSSGDSRIQQFYFVHQLAWEVLLVASGNSTEVGVLGLQSDWELWQLEDTARAELPLSASSRQETYPVGIALDTSPQYNLSQGENHSLVPMPLLALLSHEGLLVLYWAVNMLQGAKPVCEPPSPLPDTSGIHLFTSPQATAAVEDKAAESTQSASGLDNHGQGLTATSQFTSSPLSQPISTPDPRLESKTGAGDAPGSWMAPTSTAAGFMSSLTQSAFSSTTPSFPAPSLTTSSTAPPSFGVAPATTSLSFGLPPSTTNTTPTFNLPSFASPPPSTALPVFGISSPPTFGSVTTSNFTSVAPSVDTSTAPPVFNLTSSIQGFCSGVSTTNTPSTFSLPSETKVHATSAPALSVSSINPSANPPKTSFSFAPVQTSGLFSSSAPTAPANSSLTSSSRVTSVVASQAQLDIPEAPSPDPSLISSPSPTESDATEESQQLRAINEALVQEEVSHFDWELKQMRERICGINIKQIPDEKLRRLCSEVEDLKQFMVELQETTQTQEKEVNFINSFLFDAFYYIEGMNNRLRLQKNPDYITLQSPQGLDPIQNRKLADIKHNINLTEMQLLQITNKLTDKWIEFQDSNKENRKCIQIPSLESLYQTIMVQNSLVEQQKTRIEQIQAMMTTCNRKRMTSLRNVSRMVDETQASLKDAEMSKIAQDFISLNMKKDEKNIDDLHQSMNSLGVSEKMTRAAQGSANFVDHTTLFYNVIDNFPVKHLDEQFKIEDTIFNLLDSTAVSSNLSHSPSMVSTSTAWLKDQKEDSSCSNGPSQYEKSTYHSVSKTNSETPTMKTNMNDIKNLGKNHVVTVSPLKSKMSNEQSIENVTPPNNIFLQSSPNTPPKAALFTFNSSLTTNPPVSSEPVSFAITKNSPSKGFSFSSLATTQTLSGSPSSSSQAPSSPLFSNFNKPFSFSTASSGLKPEQPKTPVVTSVSTSLQISSPQNTLPETTTSAFSSPLSSLGALVSGIEPIKSNSETLSSSRGSSLTNQISLKVSPSQSSVFKISGNCENNSPINTQTLNQNINAFGLPQNKLDSGNFTSTHPKDSSSVITAQSGSAFKNVSFDSSSQKSIFSGSPSQIFGSSPPTTPPKKEETIIIETPKKSLHASPKEDEIKTDQNEPFKIALSSSSLAFGTGSNIFPTSSSSQSQTSFFSPSSFTSPSAFSVEKPSEIVVKPAVTVGDNKSPVIEISLNPTNNDGDLKQTLDKISSAKGITLTKIESPEKKDSELENKPDGNSNVQCLDSSSFNTFKTPPKSPQTIFGGSAPLKAPPLMYEVEKAGDESKPDVKVDEKQEALISQKTVEVTTSTTIPTPAFSFTIAALSKTETNETQQNKPFGFDLKNPVTTSSTSSDPASTAPQTSSLLSSSQTSSQSASSTFSFSVPSTNAPASTTTSSFGFGSLSFSGSNSKTGFSFAQSSDTSSSGNTIFGGFNSTPTSESSNIFGQSSVTPGEKKSLFGQQPTETKSIFGTPAAASDSKSAFSFSLPATTTVTQSPFFNSPTTTASNFFGQPICSPVSTTSSPFGQSSTSVFGSPAPQPFGGTSGFGSKPTFGQSGGSFFNQSSGFGTSGGSLFGGNTSTPASNTTSLFGGSIAQPASPFGQSTGSVFGGSGSFANSGQSVGQTGFGTPSFQAQPGFGSSSPPAFGATPSFGGAPTFGATASFGSPGKVFGSPPASPPSAFGGGSQQQSSTFENLATQNTMTFGNLAQNQAPSFGSNMFQQQQSAPSPPAFSPSNTGSSFGGSSFSSWR